MKKSGGSKLCATFLGFIVSALICFSCNKSSKTPDWDSAPNLVTETALPAGENSEAFPPVEAPNREKSEESGFRFVAYNVQNWLTMEREVDDKHVTNIPKPDDEKIAVIRVLVEAAPDVIGICEIGETTDLAEIQELLKTAGVNLPHLHFTGGSDPVRSLGFLSRFPIISTAKPAETDFRLHGRTFSINRGILDATVSVHGEPYRFIGVHLKSKRSTDDVDQEEMRIHEARLLRRHVDAVMKKNQDAKIVVYGDFNDTQPSSAFKTIVGNFNGAGYLTAIPLKDSRGHAWTHHWAPHDIYSRIDFITVSRSLRSAVDFEHSYLIDSADWDKASDHRALVAVFHGSS